MKKDIPSINLELASLLDFTQKDAKKFNSEFIERVENLRKYEDQVKTVQQKTSTKSKAQQEGAKGGQNKQVIKDVSKFLVPGRKISYCQCTRHNLVNNCINCGKIVCEQEGEGPCLFCGSWVDRETTYDIGDDLNEYEVALNHRDRLIEYDVNAAQRLGVLDA